MATNRRFPVESVVSEDAPGGRTWGEWEEIVEFTGEVNYGCDFDDAGCKKGHKKGCCNSCASMYGYVEQVPVEAVETLKREFDDDDGFWRPWGCAIPRKWRSLICLTHECGFDGKNGRVGWIAFSRLFEAESTMTVAKAREIMGNEGLLHVDQLVTLS